MRDFQERSDGELVQAWIDNVGAAEAIEHVGALNRHFGKRREMIDLLMARSGGRLSQLLPLLQHPDLELRYTAALEFRQVDPETFRTTLMALTLMGGEVGKHASWMLKEPPLADYVPQPPLSQDHPLFWPAHHPPPPAMPRDEIEQRISALFPHQASDLVQLLRPAIGLWPQPEQPDAPMSGSRLGGMPYAPPNWTWPVRATEPLLFIGQINCAEICHLPGAEVLPSSGILALFGDHDTVNGCMFTAMGGAVYYWPDTSRLAPALPPLEVLTVYPRAELLFRPRLEMPDPESQLLEPILPDAHLRQAYREFHTELRSYGLPSEHSLYSSSFGCVLGWPHLVQGDDLDLFLDGPPDDYRLLLQIDAYTNGKEYADWGPGGSLYYMITETALAEQDWESCDLTGQFT